eukprot:TRINITY_DN27337_c0_g1_i1.p1 TRINITY_DN27337_c0_g1~~TRINITY_DN27337_c0_g1_i1.p1  ORF type:complete len:689 (+),score=265.10 TRINITY_DN27337_c0_g1_i1:53-2119(+)
MEFSLFPLIQETPGIVGTSRSPGLSDDEVIVTERQAVHIFNVYDQRSRASWSGRHGTVFTSAAVLDTSIKQFYVVQDNKTVCTWGETSQDLGAMTKKTLAKAIHAIFALAGRALVVFTDGTVAVLDKTLAEQSHTKKAAGTVEWSDVVVRPDGSTLVLQISKDHTLHLLSVHEGDVQPRGAHKLSPPTPDATLLTASFETTSRLLSLVWSDGTWQVLELTPQHLLGESSVPPQTIGVRLSAFKLPTKKQKKTRTVQSFAFGPSRVVLVGPKAGDDDTTAYAVTLWDMVYGTVQSAHDVEPVDASLLLQVYGSLSSHHLYLVFASSVLVCQMYAPPSSLASVLGKMASTGPLIDAPRAPPAATSVNLRAALDEIYSEKPAPSGETRSVAAMLSEDLAYPESVRQENAEEETVLRSLNAAAATEDGLLPDWDAFLQRRTPAKGVSTVSSAFVSRAAERCISRRFWRLIKSLLERKLLSLQMAPELMTSIMEHTRLELLEEALRSLPDLSARELARALKFVISVVDRPALRTYVEGRVPEGLAPVDDDVAIELFITRIIAVPVNDLDLQQVLKGLTLEEALAMLRYTDRWFRLLCDESLPSLKERYGGKGSVPSLAGVTFWMCALIDAHFAELVLSPECHPLLEGIQRRAQRQIKACEKLEGLAGYLVQFKDKNPLPEQQLLDYSIQVLVL